MSRTKNTIRNLLFGYIEEFIIIILSFITRRIFVQILGTQFNGLNSVITNILSMLNLVELGFGSAIIYNLYKPLANRDTIHVKALMDYYKKIYQILGGIIAILGLILMPFLPVLIKDDITFTNVYVVFGIHLMQTVSTYLFFAYKKSLLDADQKSYIVSRIRSFFIIIQYGLQIVALKFIERYIPYLLVILIGNITFNLIVAIRVNKEYPFLKDKTKEQISMSERIEIKKNCTALFIYKINSVVLHSTNSLVLSKYVGLDIVGFYGHYLTLVNALKMMVNKVFSAMIGSLGNLHAESSLMTEDKKNREHEEAVFRSINMLSFAAFGLGSVGIFAVSSAFIDIWIGKGQTLSRMAVLLIALEILIYGYAKPTASFRTSMGLFQQAKYRPIASMILNLVISLSLVKKYEVVGVLIGTVLSTLLTTFWFDPIIIYRHGFRMSSKKYFLRIVRFFIIEVITLFIVSIFQKVINLDGFVGVIVYGIVSVIVFTILFILILHKLPEYNTLKSLALSMLKCKRKEK